MAIQGRWTVLAALFLGDISISIAVGGTAVSTCAADDADMSAMLQVSHRSVQASNPVVDGAIDDWNQVADMVNQYYQEYGDTVKAGYDITMGVMGALDDLEKGGSWQDTIIAVANDLMPVVNLLCPTVGTVAGLFLSLFSSPAEHGNELEQLRQQILEEVSHMIDDRVAMDNYKGALAAVHAMTDVINDHPKWVGNETPGYIGDWNTDAGTVFRQWGDMATQNLRFVFSTECLDPADGHSPTKKKSETCLLFQRFGPLIFQAQFANLHLNLIAQWGAYIPTDQPTCKNDMVTWAARYAALLEDSLSGFLSVVEDSNDHTKEHLIPPCKYAYPSNWGHVKCGSWLNPHWYKYNCDVSMDASNIVDPVTQLNIADVAQCTTKYSSWVKGDYCKCNSHTGTNDADQARCKDAHGTHCFGGELCEYRDEDSLPSKDGRPLCTNEHYTAYRQAWMGGVERLQWPLIVRMKACGQSSAVCNMTSLEHSGTRLFSSYPIQFGQQQASGKITLNGSVVGISVVIAGDCQGNCANDAGVVKGFGLLGASPDELRKIQPQSTSSTSVNLPADGVFKPTGSTIAVCPAGLVVTGLTAHWKGTCGSKCNNDGPVLSSMTLKCGRVPQTHSQSSFLIQPQVNSATSADCADGTAITSLWVNTAGACGGACKKDAPMIAGIGGECGAFSE